MSVCLWWVALFWLLMHLLRVFWGCRSWLNRGLLRGFLEPVQKKVSFPLWCHFLDKEDKPVSHSSPLLTPPPNCSPGEQENRRCKCYTKTVNWARIYKHCHYKNTQNWHWKHGAFYGLFNYPFIACSVGMGRWRDHWKSHPVAARWDPKRQTRPVNQKIIHGWIMHDTNTQDVLEQGSNVVLRVTRRQMANDVTWCSCLAARQLYWKQLDLNVFWINWMSFPQCWASALIGRCSFIFFESTTRIHINGCILFL